jgi:hypothetical protein
LSLQREQKYSPRGKSRLHGEQKLVLGTNHDQKKEQIFIVHKIHEYKGNKNIVCETNPDYMGNKKIVRGRNLVHKKEQIFIVWKINRDYKGNTNIVCGNKSRLHGEQKISPETNHDHKNKQIL